MNILFGRVLASFLLAMVVAGSACGQTANPTWITDVTIISPENLDHIGTGSVLIEDGRIARVDRGQARKKPAGATIVSGKGLFLIPGLIDSHVHLAVVPGVSYEVSLTPAEKRPSVLKRYPEQLPRSYLYFGYTTLIDLAVIDQQALDKFRQAPVHPDLYDCGGSLPLANGYPMSFVPPETRFKLFPNFIYDPKQASAIPPEYRPQDHTPAAGVAAVMRSHGICVKTYFERGYGADRNLPVMGPEVAAEIRRAATRAGLVLMMHANTFEAQKFAVRADVDVIAHGLWNWGDLYKQTELPPEMKDLLDEIVRKRIGYQATLQVIEGFRANFDSEYLNTPGIPKVIPAEMLEWLKSPEGKWFKKELADANVPDAMMRQNLDNGPLRRVRLVLAYLAGKDANFLFATDTPSSPTYGNLPGLNGYLEMQQLYEAGLSLKQIFRAATINNAREFKIDSQVGTIEPGKVANLLLLRKSPLESPDAYDSIVTVWVHGKPISRESLSATANK